MKEMLLAVVMVLIFIIGYYMAGGIDRFVERSRRARMGALEEERGGSEAGEGTGAAAGWTLPKGECPSFWPAQTDKKMLPVNSTFRIPLG